MSNATYPTVTVTHSANGWQIDATNGATDLFLFDGDGEHGWTIGPDVVAVHMRRDSQLLDAIAHGDIDTLFERADVIAERFEWVDTWRHSMS